MNTSQPANAQAILEGEALHAFMDQAHDLLQQEDETSPIAPAERQAAVMELLSQQRVAPATVSELERLHDLWLDLERPETANALLREHRDATLQHLQGDNHLLATASLALSDIQSRLRFDREGGVALLAPAADLMGRLPHTGEPYRYWNGWHYLAREAQAWELAEKAWTCSATTSAATPTARHPPRAATRVPACARPSWPACAAMCRPPCAMCRPPRRSWPWQTPTRTWTSTTGCTLRAKCCRWPRKAFRPC
ncbi:hypothetical protein GY14_11845 [Delftia tsuruhatensis]|nr:hypothetical protein GY14_11845 [Delftia tsuruhatensis]